MSGTDLAEIGFAADTSDLARARESLLALGPAGERADDAAEKLAKQFDKTGARAKAFDAAISKTGSALRLFASGAVGFATGVLASFSFDPLITGAREYSNSVAILSTNLTVGSGELEKFTAAAANMADTFGTSAAFQVNALYDTVSAGVTEIAAATDLVTTANKLAVGGLSNVGTAVDVLTTIVNSYSASGYTAGEASDALFIAMKAGKTTVDQLATQMGQIVPIASALGVGFDELTAGLAALTLSGLNTAQATTGLRAILTAVAKPTSEAAKLAKKLGLDFSAAALQSKGLAGWLQDVVAKSGGSSDALAILFGSVEALNAALAFAGVGGANFTNILEQMGAKAGATETAYNAIAESLDKRLGVVMQKITNSATTLGSALLSFIVPIGEIITGIAPLPKALELIINLMIAAFGPLMIARIASLTLAIGTGLIAAINAVRIALIALALSNPFTAILQGALLVATALYTYSETFRTAVNGMADHIKNAFVVAYQFVLQAWSTLPAAFADLGIQAANGILSAFGAPEIKNAFAGSAKEVMDIYNKVIADQRKAPRIMIYGGKPAASPSETGTTSTTSTVSTITEDAEKQKTALQKITEQINKLSAPFSQATEAFSALKEALTNGVITNEEYATSLSKINDAFTNAGGTSEQWKKIIEPDNSKIKAVGEEFKSFLGELKSGIAQGQSFWDAFKNAGLNALDRIIDKVTNDLVDALTSSGSGGSNLISSIIGAFAGGGTTPKFADGGVFTNSVVSTPTLFKFAGGGKFGEMGEAGPEAIMPLKKGPNGSLGVQMYGANSGGGQSNNVTYAPQYSIAPGVTTEEFATLKKTVEQDRQQFIGRVSNALNQQIRRNGR